MQKIFQALPALLASGILLILAVGLFVPREQLPAWLVERIPNRVAAPVAVTPSDSADPESDVPPASALNTASTPSSTASPPHSESISPSLPFVPPVERTRPETDAELMNCYFTALPAHPSDAPRVVDVPFPKFPGSHAVWAGTGRDLEGRVWIGGCAEGGEQPSARLFCYDSRTGEMTDAGDVLSALEAQGLLHAGESQMKIHSKIIQAGDGHLYFATMDERGEKPDGSQLPTWGGHLWRLRLPERKWEHLHATKEALIAVAGMGRYIYALGYFGHVLVQWDTEMDSVRTITVGSVDGHVSRNFLADRRGHVFVPRLTRAPGTDTVEASLVEYDAALNVVNATLLEGYCGPKPTDSHGITGVQPMADGSLAFVTHRGRLFHITPADSGPAEVKDLGWMHPLGEMAIESLFTYDGHSWLMAVAKLPSEEWDWVAFDRKSSASVTRPLGLPVRYSSVNKGLLLYGSMTRDAEGAFYLVGTSMNMAPQGPVVWRLMPGR